MVGIMYKNLVITYSLTYDTLGNKPVLGKVGKQIMKLSVKYSMWQFEEKSSHINNNKNVTLSSQTGS